MDDDQIDVCLDAMVIVLKLLYYLHLKAVQVKICINEEKALVDQCSKCVSHVCCSQDLSILLTLLLRMY